MSSGGKRKRCWQKPTAATRKMSCRKAETRLTFPKRSIRKSRRNPRGERGVISGIGKNGKPNTLPN